MVIQLPDMGGKKIVPNGFADADQTRLLEYLEASKDDKLDNLKLELLRGNQLVHRVDHKSLIRVRDLKLSHEPLVWRVRIAFRILPALEGDIARVTWKTFPIYHYVGHWSFGGLPTSALRVEADLTFAKVH